MDPSSKNCKQIRNWIIGLKFFPLENENGLLHAKKNYSSPDCLVSLLQIKNGKLSSLSRL